MWSKTEWFITKQKHNARSDSSVSHLPFARGCTPRNWASAVKLREIQQIFSLSVKCTDEMYKRKVEVEENTQLWFWRKKSKDQATNLPWMSLSLFSLRLESAKEKPNERRFKLHFVCFYRRESLFEMEIYQLPLCYWLFSRTDVKFKIIFLGNTLRFEIALLCSFHRID